MNAPAIQSPEFDIDHATQCLVAMHDITSNLLRMTAQGKNWSKIDIRSALKLTECSTEFVQACGMSARVPTPSELPSDAWRKLRILGQLHLAIGQLLIDSAQRRLRLDLVPHPHGMQVHGLHEMTVEFVASVSP